MQPSGYLRSLVTAVIVLYQRSAADSEAWKSFHAILAANPETARQFQLVLYDNSPMPSPPPPAGTYPVSYVHDAANKGLAAAYNFALSNAETHRTPWLLLLDQDTTLTTEFLHELLQQIQQTKDDSIAAFVPFLELDGRIYSPETDFFHHLRHQFPYARNYYLDSTSHGIQPRRLNAYNSGATLRVDALRSIGGFPADFPLDYLDHAVFAKLQQHGFSIFVLHAVLQQQLSHIDLNAVSPARHRSVLDSQTRFVQQHGTRLDRLLYRLWLLRKSRHYRRLCSDPRVWKSMARRSIGPWPRLEGQP